MRRNPLIPLLIAALALTTPAAAQCLLANPSFEFDGTTGTVFQAWQQFGPVGVTPDATHGQRGVRVAGPDTGQLSVAGVWQPLDSGPDDVWDVEVDVRAIVALGSGSRALVNVEWRDADDQLIDDVSFDALVAGGSSSTTFTGTSPPAPPNTASVRLLLGVLQDAGDPQPVVAFDRALFERRTVPSLDERQWHDFPGGRTVDFAGHTWRVKGPGIYGPGPNLFGDGPENVRVDADGRLVMALTNDGGTWTSAEIALADVLGYGDYVFTTRGRVDALDPSAVLGLFLWEYGACWSPGDLWWNPYNEIDIEFSRWNEPDAPNAQFVVQPWDIPGNRQRFDVTFADDEIASHAFRWSPDRVEFRSWRGGPEDEATAPVLHTWTSNGPFLPRPGRARVHVNLWWNQTPPATPQTIVLEDFRFVPAGTVAVDAPPARTPRTLRAHPNPFNPSTTVSFALDRPARVTLIVLDVRGRRVRTLADGRWPSGPAEIEWNGRDDRGAPVASGVYHLRLVTTTGATTRSESLPLTLVQ